MLVNKNSSHKQNTSPTCVHWLVLSIIKEENYINLVQTLPKFKMEMNTSQFIL